MASLVLSEGKTFNRIVLSFDSGCFDTKIDSLPDYIGLYFVYRVCKGEDGKYYISHLEPPIYIGKAEDSVRSRMKEHIDDGSLQNWKDRYCESEDFIYICTCPLEESIEDAEAACIFHIQPLANIDNKNSYNGANIYISIEGSYVYLNEQNKRFKVLKGSTK